MRIVILFLSLAISGTLLAQTDTLKSKSDSIPAPVSTTEQPTAPKQKRDNRPLKERIAVGFGTGFWINVNTTYIELSPVIAYRFPKALVTGVGYRYIYRHDRIYGVDLNSWGPNFFTRLQLIKSVYLWTEYEILTSQYLAQVAGQDLGKVKDTYESLFAGLGFIRSVGKKGRGGISVQVLYNFLYDRDDYTPYYSPVTYRVGYYF